MASTVGTRGQITIEKQLRDELGVKPGWRAIQRRVGNHVDLRFIPPRHRDSLRGALADPNAPKFSTDEELEEAIDRAWELEVREKFGALES